MSTYSHFTILAWTRFGIEPKPSPSQTLVDFCDASSVSCATNRDSKVLVCWATLGVVSWSSSPSPFGFSDFSSPPFLEKTVTPSRAPALGCFPKDTDKTGTGNNYNGVAYNTTRKKEKKKTNPPCLASPTELNPDRQYNTCPSAPHRPWPHLSARVACPPDQPDPSSRGHRVLELPQPHLSVRPTTVPFLPLLVVH